MSDIAKAARPIRGLWCAMATPIDGHGHIAISAQHPSIPGMKAMMAARKADDTWLAMLPPHLALADPARRSLISALRDAGLPASRA